MTRTSCRLALGAALLALLFTLLGRPRPARADGVADEAALKARLEELVRGRLTVPVEIQLVPAGTIPRSQKKTALVRLESAEEER
jgi:hypothetical protein